MNKHKRKSPGHSTDAHSVSSSDSSTLPANMRRSKTRYPALPPRFEAYEPCANVNVIAIQKTHTVGQIDPPASQNQQALANPGSAITEKAPSTTEDEEKKEYGSYVESAKAEQTKRQKLNEPKTAFIKTVFEAINTYMTDQNQQLQMDHDVLCEEHEGLLSRHKTHQASYENLLAKSKADQAENARLLSFMNGFSELNQQLINANNQWKLSYQALRVRVEQLEKSEKDLNAQVETLKQQKISVTDKLLNSMDEVERYEKHINHHPSLQRATIVQDHFSQGTDSQHFASQASQSQPILSSFHNVMANAITTQSQPMYASNTYGACSYPPSPLSSLALSSFTSRPSIFNDCHKYLNFTNLNETPLGAPQDLNYLHGDCSVPT